MNSLYDFQLNNADSQLNKMLRYVCEYVGFYSGFAIPRSIDGFLYDFPVINKRIIKYNYSEFISRDALNEGLLNAIFSKADSYGDYIIENTSGTSGIPFRVVKSNFEQFLLSKTHAKLRNRIFKVDFNGIVDLFEDVTIFKNCNTIEDEIKILENDKLIWWSVYPFQLVKYEKYLREHIDKKLPVKYIEYTGAFLSAREKKKFERIFACKLINNYSCREVWSIAYDCREGNLHINTDCIYFELIDNDGNIISDVNKIGKVVVTSLKQKVMPFVRYETGDYAYYKNIKCKCGCKAPVISLVPKRDFIDGTNILGSVYFQAVISDLVQEYKIMQFDSIYVEQTDRNAFNVYIIKNREKREEIEKYFTLCAKDKLADAVFNFFYTDYSEKKGIFQKTNILC